MQLFAYDNHQTLIFARVANRGEDYFCRECGSRVRLRSGACRKAHFYHIDPDRPCRQSQKSLRHIQVQFHLQDLLNLNSSELERRFPLINRIADVVWEAKKLIFEVQCSPITADEVRARNRDYNSVGYQVVWLLHDHRFNRFRMTAAETFLLGSPHYFTNIDGKGRGIIYDQVDEVERGRRQIYLKNLPVNLYNHHIMEDELSSEGLSKTLMCRIKHWSMFFDGDILFRFQQGDSGIIEALSRCYQKCDDNKKTSLRGWLKALWTRVMTRPYQIFFRMMLEKQCR